VAHYDLGARPYLRTRIENEANWAGPESSVSSCPHESDTAGWERDWDQVRPEQHRAGSMEIVAEARSIPRPPLRPKGCSLPLHRLDFRVCEASDEFRATFRPQRARPARRQSTAPSFCPRVSSEGWVGRGERMVRLLEAGALLRAPHVRRRAQFPWPRAKPQHLCAPSSTPPIPFSDSPGKELAGSPPSIIAPWP